MTTPVAERQVAETNQAGLAQTSVGLSRLAGFREFRTAYWAVVPLLATISYITVLRIGFLADDFALINRAKDTQFGLQDIVHPQAGTSTVRSGGCLPGWLAAACGR